MLLNYQSSLIMKDSNDKQNEIPTIDLDFKKKQKVKSNTDRTHNNFVSNLPRKESLNDPIKSNFILLEKKKQYSMAIREKNLSSNVKKPKIQELREEQQQKKSSKISLNVGETPRSNSLVLNQSSIVCNKMEQKYKTGAAKSKPGKENQAKSKFKESKRDSTKSKKIGYAIEDLKLYGLSKNTTQMYSNEKSLGKMSKFDANISLIGKIDDFSLIEPQQPSFCVSNQIDQCFGPYQTEDMKESELLRRQNATFKKQLATFRKDNGSLKREIDQLKKKMSDLQQQNQYLSGQNEDNIKMLESFQLRMCESLQSFNIKQQQPQFLGQQLLQDNKMKQILVNYQNQLFQATSQNKKLQFRNYMLEKRLLDESEAHKKIMARQISIWKQRYIKARNENLRLKDSRSSMLFEMSISEDL